MDELTVTIAVAAALLTAVVEIIKRTIDAWATSPPNPDRYVPALTLVLGVVAGGAGLLDEGGWLAGLIAALTASGAYSSVKATATSSLRRPPDESGDIATAVGLLVFVVALVLIVAFVVATVR